MKSKTILTLLLLTGCASSVGRAHADAVTVMQVNIPKVYSGVIASFVEIHVQQGGQDRVVIYPYMDEQQELPKVGQKCVFQVERKSIEGVVWMTFVKRYPADVVQHFDCK